MLDQPIDSVDEATLAQLVANQVAERRDLDFKRDLHGRKDAEVKEFLADVTSLANAQGGDLIFGIEEEGGIAVALRGVEVTDVDAEILRLESSIRSGVDPRLIGLRTQWVPLASGKGALVIRVPAGLAAPHRVIFGNSNRFYNRNSRGKYEMDLHELRHSFTQSEQLPLRFRQLHIQGINAARGIDMPFAIDADPTAVVSVIPLAHFREERDIPITRDHALTPIKTSGYSSINMIEGVVLHNPIDAATGTVPSFAVTHRSGRTDVAWTIGGVRTSNSNDELRLVFASSFEEGLLDSTVATQTRLRQFGVEGPWVILVSVYGVKGYFMALSNDGKGTRTAFRDQALLGEIRADHIDEAALLPFLKNFWLLFGEHRPEGRPIGQN